MNCSVFSTFLYNFWLFVENETLLFMVKYFCVVFCGFYLLRVFLSITQHMIFAEYIFSVGLSVIALLVRLLGTQNTYLTVVLFCIISAVYYKQSMLISVLESVIAVGFSYVTWCVAAILVFPLMRVLQSVVEGTALLRFVSAVCVGFIQFALIRLLTCIGRFKNGMPFLREKSTSVFGAIVSVILLIAISFASFITDDFIPAYVIAISELGLVLLVWWHYKLVIRFHQRSKQKQISDLEAENQQLQDLSDRQAKIIHTDTRIVSAMGSSLKGVMESADYPTPEARQRANDLLDYLDAAAQKRDRLLFENRKDEPLQETGITAVDSMIGYLHSRADSEGITFTFARLASVRHMTETVISEDDLTTLLGDLLTNAIIAERTTDMKNLMLVIRTTGSDYVIDVSDSGEPFAPEVISKIGRERITTHADSGGSGYGMVTTFEILERTGASFVLEELEDGPYTKRLSVCFDGLSQIRVKSKRPVILAIRDARKDIIWI